MLWEPKIRAFVTLNLASARTAADVRASAGGPEALSPIDGMPIGVKDIIETIDMPTGNGSPLFDGFPVSATARAWRPCARPAR